MIAATPSRRLGLAALALLAAELLSFVAYAPSLRGELVFDDHPLLVESDCHRSLRRIPDLFVWSGGGICTVRPLRFVSYAIDHAIWGDRPLGYHLTNVVLHGLVGWLALLWLLRLTRDPRLAALGAGLFLLHPIATEAVAYVSGRRDLLMALFGLLSALLLEGYRQRGGPWRVPLMLVTLAGALLSHEAAAAIPLALIALELCRAFPPEVPRSRGLLPALRALLGPRLRLALPALLVLATAFSLWSVLAHSISERTGLWGGGLGAHVGTVLRVHLHYLRQLLLPWPLVADYSPEGFPIARSLLEARVVLAGSVIAGLFVGAWLALPRRRLLAAAILGYFALLLPTSQIVVHHELLAEHRLYLPSLCFCAVLASGLSWASRRSRWVLALAAALAITGLLLTRRRALDWTSSERLWTVTVAQVPRAARAHLNLGVVRARAKRFLEARAHFETALSIRPEHCDARLAHGQVLLDLGQPGPGLEELRRAVACRPSPRALNALGTAALRQGRADEAERVFRRALARGEDPRLRLGLGRALRRRGDAGGAAGELRAALRLKPRWAPALRELALALAAGCRLAEAGAALQELRQLGPDPRLLRLERTVQGLGARCPPR